MLEWAQQLDGSLMLRINRDIAGPFLDHVLPTFSSFAGWMPFIIIAAILLAWRGSFSGRAFIVCATCAALFSEGIVSGPIKKTVGRLRPHDVLPEVIKRTLPGGKLAVVHLFGAPDEIPARPAPTGSRGRSFPSSHTVNMFAVATVAVAFFGTHGLWLMLIAAIVALSRVYCGVHWPSDIAGSAALGLLSGWVFLQIASAVWKARGSRWLPALHASHPQLLPARRRKISG